MAKYIKRPIGIKAFKYDGDLMNSKGEYCVPEWAIKALNSRVMYYEDRELHIKTLEGIHHVSVGDYVIQGIQGELYPCKPDIFEKAYDKVV